MKKVLKICVLMFVILIASYFLGDLCSPSTVSEEFPIIIKMILGMLCLLILVGAYMGASLIAELLEI
jgi:hypothetical protein